MPLLVSPHLIMQQLPNLSFLTTDLSFILNITAKFHFFSIKTDKITWKTKKNRHFSKMAKARLMLTSSKFVMTPNFFFSSNGVWLSWTTVEESAKNEVILKLRMRWFWREPFTIQNYRKMSFHVSPKGIMQGHWNFVLDYSFIT